MAFTVLSAAAIAVFGQPAAVVIAKVSGDEVRAVPTVAPAVAAVARATVIRAKRVTFSPVIQSRQSQITGEMRRLVEFE